MGQFFSWFRGTQDTPSLQDVTVTQQSDPKQSKPAPAVPVSTVKPTVCEKGVASSSSTGPAAKPGTPAAGASTTPTVTAAGSGPAATVGAGLSAGAKVSAGASPGPSTTGAPSTGAAGSTGTQSGSSKVTAQAPPASPAKASNASAGSGTKGGVGAGGGAVTLSTSQVKPKDTSTDKAQSTAVSSSKPEPPKVTSAGAAKSSATANVSISADKKDDTKSKEAKVGAEGPAPTAKASAPVSAIDPFDALADSLPSETLAPKAPQYTGPEVKEEKKIPAEIPYKPKEHPKPITTDEALESLSAGFVSSEVPSRSASLPKQEVQRPASQSPAAPADKKAKVHAEGPAPTVKASAPEKKIPAEIPYKPKEHPKPLIDDAVDSLSAGFVSSSPPKLATKQEVAPPADKKGKVEKLARDPVTVASSQPVKSETDEGVPMSLDALDALGDMLPDSQSVPEAPPPRPQDLVKEKELDPKKGVRVGEREDSLPPDYRFSKEDLKKYPAPPKEPSLDPAEALDILSGDFCSTAEASVVQAPVPPSAPLKQQGDTMSLDALSALGDTLPEAKPTPESPKLRPEDIVDEKKLKSEKGVRVGEREDTIPPDYRFSKGDGQKHPAPPQREPSMDAAAALDILSGDFSTPDEASPGHAPLPPSAPPSAADFAIEELAGDFVAPTAVSKVQSAAPAPPKADRQLSENTASALDALGDTLMDVGTVPEPAPVSPKDIVKEKQAVEERVSKPGERDDSLPPEYRPTEADIKAAAEAKAKAKAEAPAKQASMDESAALDVLSSDFSAPSVAPPAAPIASTACHPHDPAIKTPPKKTAAAPVLDARADTLPPDSKPKDSKPKVKGGKSKSKPKKPAVASVPAPDDVSGKMRTDVAISKKGGKS